MLLPTVDVPVDEVFPMNKPASAPDVVPPREPPQPGPDVVPPPDRPQAEPDGEGTNATIHRPDDQAAQHPANPDHKTRGPYVTGNT